MSLAPEIFGYREPTHVEMYDRVARTAFIERLGITDEQLRKAVAMVGTRMTTIANYLGKPL